MAEIVEVVTQWQRSRLEICRHHHHHLHCHHLHRHHLHHHRYHLHPHHHMRKTKSVDKEEFDTYNQRSSLFLVQVSPTNSLPRICLFGLGLKCQSLGLRCQSRGSLRPKTNCCHQFLAPTRSRQFLAQHLHSTSIAFALHSTSTTIAPPNSTPTSLHYFTPTCTLHFENHQWGGVGCAIVGSPPHPAKPLACTMLQSVDNPEMRKNPGHL